MTALPHYAGAVGQAEALDGRAPGRCLVARPAAANQLLSVVLMVEAAERDEVESLSSSGGLAQSELNPIRPDPQGR